MTNDAKDANTTTPRGAAPTDGAVQGSGPYQALRPSQGVGGAPGNGAGSSANAGKVGTFYALGIRDYRLLWTSNLFASAGMWIQMATLGWVVYDLTGSGTLLGSVNAMRSIPMLLLAPLAGVAADRMDRRNLMIVTQVIIVLTTFAVAVGLLFDRVEIWHLFAFTLIAGTSQVFFMPAQQTVVFDLVPRPGIPNAVALNTAAFNITRVLGPSAAGYLITWLGPEGNFFAQSAAYVGVVISLAMIAFPRRQAPSGRGSVLRNVAEGFRYVAKNPNTRVLLVLAVLPPLLIIPAMMSLMPIFASDVFHSGPTGLGFLMSASGLGGLLGALFTASLGRFDRRGLLLLVMLFSASVALLLFAFMDSMTAALPFLVVAGFCELTYMATTQTLIQLSVPDEMRGRVISLFMLIFGLMPMGSLAFGAGADVIGAQGVVKVASIAALVVGLLIAVVSPRVRNLRLSQIGPPPTSGPEPVGAGMHRGV
ncbi:MAG: MFS transporter [Chloroflexi bacterium]|nr:MFS transporter [Chloroflexota bacterium]